MQQEPRAEPLLAAQTVRDQLRQRLRTDAEFIAFVLDHFPTVHQRLSDGMDRLAKENLLLAMIDTSVILTTLHSMQSTALWAAPPAAHIPTYKGTVGVTDVISSRRRISALAVGLFAGLFVVSGLLSVATWPQWHLQPSDRLTAFPATIPARNLSSQADDRSPSMSDADMGHAYLMVMTPQNGGKNKDPKVTRAHATSPNTSTTTTQPSASPNPRQLPPAKSSPTREPTTRELLDQFEKKHAFDD